MSRHPSRPLSSSPQGRADLFVRGDLLAETYEIRGKLGEGGMGEVYAAWDRALQRWVAIKATRPEAGATVVDEARALAVVHHPSTVSVYALGSHGGIDYVVMEMVRGSTLEAHLRHRRAERAAVPIHEVVDILARIADGLAVVHRAGMAHRDVKPANVLLAPGNRVVLTDFGIFQPEIQVVHGIRVAGSPAYMAPESIVGLVAPGELYLVDVYALGIVAYEMAIGQLPYDDAVPTRVFLKHLRQPVPRIGARRPEVPPELDALVFEMLAKDPKARPQSMEEIAWRLRQIPTDRTDRTATSAPPSALVVDDNEATAAILASLIASISPKSPLRIARDGAEALHMLEAAALPDLLVVDLHMPRVGGADLCARVGKMHPAEPCITVCTSAHATDDELDELRALPFVRYVAKGEPFLHRLPAFVRAAEERAARREQRLRRVGARSTGAEGGTLAPTLPSAH
jgi:serine/threonine protein kinase